jgi:hypothetical protein
MVLVPKECQADVEKFIRVEERSLSLEEDGEYDDSEEIKE